MKLSDSGAMSMQNYAETCANIFFAMEKAVGECDL